MLHTTDIFLYCPKFLFVPSLLSTLRWGFRTWLPCRSRLSVGRQFLPCEIKFSYIISVCLIEKAILITYISHSSPLQKWSQCNFLFVVQPDRWVACEISHFEKWLQFSVIFSATALVEWVKVAAFQWTSWSCSLVFIQSFYSISKYFKQLMKYLGYPSHDTVEPGVTMLLLYPVAPLGWEVWRQWVSCPFE